MNNFNEQANRIINAALKLASRSGGLLGTEHILCAIAETGESKAAEILAKHGFNADSVESVIKLGDAVNSVAISARTKGVMDTAQRIANSCGYNLVAPEQLLYALLTYKNSYAYNALIQLGVNIDEVKDELRAEMNIDSDNDIGGSGVSQSDGLFNFINNIFGGGQSAQAAMQSGAKGQKSESKNSDELDKVGVDLTELAKQNKLDPVIGRKDEIDRIIQILSRRSKNNPVLIGEAGVGKSAIVEGLAQAIVAGNVPEMLKDKRVFSLDMTSVVAGTKYRGEFEEKLQNAINAVKKAGNIILFIDEIHTIVGAGNAEGSMDAGNILKPMLARGELQTIGATTIDEYRKSIEKDPALERRFQPIMVNPPSVDDTVLILKGIRDKYEAHHKVTISDEAINAAAVLSDRYISDRFLPDKAIDLIDEAASKKRISSFVQPKELQEKEDSLIRINKELEDAVAKQDFAKAQELKDKRQETESGLKELREEWAAKKESIEMAIGEEEIAEIVSSWTGIPVVKLTESEADRLLHLEEVLHKRVVGQEEAISSISRAVRRARAGLKDPKRPIGSFIFLGPTGVGKTEISKALAEAMFGDENLMIRLDMSEYMEKHNVSKLIGSAPGYVGYEEGGQLTEKIRRKPYSVVLFDEIEKAHPDVFNILLQILDDGRLTDSHGRVVSFKNTVIIMTSNIGAGEINKMPKLGFGASADKAQDDYEKMKETQMEALKKVMRPEFINRLDDIVIFHRLEREEITKIADLMIASLAKRLAERNINIRVTDAARDIIADKGYDKEYGARPLRRAVQRMIEDELSEQILAGKISIGDNVTVDGADGKLTFTKEEKAADNA